MKIRILSIDIDKSEGSDTIIDKSKGVKNYTLYIFKSNALAKTSVGLTDVHAGDILFLGRISLIISEANKGNGHMMPFPSKARMPLA